MAPKQTDPQFKLRLTPEIKTAIEQAAEKNGRSMNAEILARLDESMLYSPPIDYEHLGEVLKEQDAELIQITVVGNVREVLLREKVHADRLTQAFSAAKKNVVRAGVAAAEVNRLMRQGDVAGEILELAKATLETAVAAYDSWIAIRLVARFRNYATDENDDAREASAIREIRDMLVMLAAQSNRGKSTGDIDVSNDD